MIELTTRKLPELRASDAENLAGRSDEDTGRAHLSHSSLNTQLACMQKYGYEYVDRIEPIVKGKPLLLGRAFQAAIANDDPQVAMALVLEHSQVMDQAQEDQARIDAMIAASAATGYLARYPKLEAEAMEFEYRVRLRNPWTGHYSRTFDLLGYADAVNELDDHHELIENKLVGTITDVSVKRLPLDRQLALSCYGVWRATAKPVIRVRYRFTRKPSIRQKKDESIDQFLERIQADYTERPDFYFVEEKLFRSAEDLVRVEAELWEWAEQRRQAHRRGTYPRNSSHCHDYGGCPFIPICTGDADAPSLYQPKASEQEEQRAEKEEVPA